MEKYEHGIMNNISILLLVTLLIIPSTVSARLGETVEENQARYGQPVKNYQDTKSPLLKNADNRTYHYQGWKIRIGFFNDHAVRIFYGKLPKPNTTQQLKSYEIEAVLKAEAHGGKWKKLRPASLLAEKKAGIKCLIMPNSDGSIPIKALPIVP